MNVTATERKMYSDTTSVTIRGFRMFIRGFRMFFMERILVTILILSQVSAAVSFADLLADSRGGSNLLAGQIPEEGHGSTQVHSLKLKERHRRGWPGGGGLRSAATSLALAVSLSVSRSLMILFCLSG